MLDILNPLHCLVTIVLVWDWFCRAICRVLYFCLSLLAVQIGQYSAP